MSLPGHLLNSSDIYIIPSLVVPDISLEVVPKFVLATVSGTVAAVGVIVEVVVEAVLLPLFVLLLLLVMQAPLEQMSPGNFSPQSTSSLLI